MKEKNEVCEPMSKMMISFLNMDRLFSYSYLAAELHMSSRTVSAIRGGKNICINHYVKVIGLVLHTIHLNILTSVLFQRVRFALYNKRDVVVGTIPHTPNGPKEPDDWVVVTKWD